MKEYSQWKCVSYPGFPGGSEVKVSACNAGDLGSIPEFRRSPGERNGNLLQYSCLENPMDGGAWWATVHGVAKSLMWLSDFTFTFFTLGEFMSKCSCGRELLSMRICQKFGSAWARKQHRWRVRTPEFMSILLIVVSGTLSYFIWPSLGFPICQMGKMRRNFHLLNVRHSDKHILYIPSDLIFTPNLRRTQFYLHLQVMELKIRESGTQTFVARQNHLVVRTQAWIQINSTEMCPGQGCLK